MSRSLPSGEAAPTGDPSSLEVDGLGIRRADRWLFRGMSWKVPRGRVIAVVGPSGIGKSSLLRVLAGVDSPTEGAIRYRCPAGCEHGPGDYGHRLGFVFQNLRLNPCDSLLANVLCGRLGRYPWWRTLLGFPSGDRREAADALAKLGLASRLHAWAAEVSGGEQQRAAVARALFQQPDLLLADEPVSQLDPWLAHVVLRAIREHVLATRCTALVVLHDGSLVASYADLVLSLDPSDPSCWKLRELPRPRQGTAPSNAPAA